MFVGVTELVRVCVRVIGALAVDVGVPLALAPGDSAPVALDVRVAVDDHCDVGDGVGGAYAHVNVYGDATPPYPPTMAYT